MSTFDNTEPSDGATVHNIRIVDPETCETEFNRFLLGMDLDIDTKGMDEEDRASFESAKRIIIRAMSTNHLVVNDDDECVYTPKKGDQSPIIFHEPRGASLMAQDKKKEGHDIAKTFAVLADLTQQPAKRFSQMAQRDLKVCSAILVLFLG